MTVKDFRELRVYQLAFKSAMLIFELSQAWPKEERYSLTDQVRRSSRSVCSNIAEGWRKRRYEAAFVSKFSDADKRLNKLETKLEQATEEYDELEGETVLELPSADAA